MFVFFIHIHPYLCWVTVYLNCNELVFRYPCD